MMEILLFESVLPIKMPQMNLWAASILLLCCSIIVRSLIQNLRTLVAHVHRAVIVCVHFPRSDRRLPTFVWRLVTRLYFFLLMVFLLCLTSFIPFVVLGLR